MKTVIITLSLCSVLMATDRYVCHVDPPSPAASCSTYNPNRYNNINAAIAAASGGDRILVVPQSGSCAESGHVGAHCVGNDDCTTPAAISLGYDNSSLTFTTSKYAKLPAAGTRITTDYLYGATPIVAEIRNPPLAANKVAPMIVTSYGSQSCDQLRNRRFSSGATLIGTTAVDNAWRVPVNGYLQVGDKLVETATTGYHYAQFAHSTSSSTNYASVLIGAGLQRSVAICFGAPSSGHCVIANPATGTIGSCATITSCGIEDWGINPNHLAPDPTNFPHVYKVWITWDASIAGDPDVYVALASGSTLSYAGDGTSAAYVYDARYVDIKPTDPDFGPVYTCPAHDITFRGLALTGGSNGTSYPILSLGYAISYDNELTAGEESAYNLTVDQNIIITDPITELVRNPILTAARNVTITNNWFATASRSGSDGGLCCGFLQGPATIANNYMEALPSGFGTGGAANAIHTLKGAIWDFPQTCCTSGWNGTNTYEHNFIWKPEWARAHLWTANYFVQKNAMWTPSGGGNAMHFIAQNSGTTGSSEPTWNSWSGSSVPDGGVTWVPESDPVSQGGVCNMTGWTANGTWECYYGVSWRAYGNPTYSYTAGSYMFISGTICAWQAMNTGTAAGTQGATLSGACTQGQSVVDGGVTWRGLSPTWAAGKTYAANDRINYPATSSGALYYVASVGGVSGGMAPDWTTCITEGCTLADGGVTWVGSFRNGNMYTSKNNLDMKECKGCIFQHNYFFNSFPQNRSGGGQGNIAEWSTQPQSGGPWEEQSSQILGNVFDKATVGLLLFGFDPSPEANWSNVGQPCHTNLTTGVNSSATAWVVGDSGHFTVNNFYQIDSRTGSAEWVKVTAITDTTHVTVARAQRSTTGVSHSAGAQIDPTSYYLDPSPVCYNNINPGNTHDMTVTNNRVTNVMQGLSSQGCDLVYACGGSSGIALGVFSVVTTAALDHNTVDGTGVPQGVANVGQADNCVDTVPAQYFPNSNFFISNSILNITGGTEHFFRASCWGDDFPTINSQMWNVPYVPGSQIADGFPDANAAAGSFSYHGNTVNQAVYGNLIPGATLAAGPTIAPQTGVGTIPTHNAITPLWADIGWTTSINGLPSDYTIPPSSPAYHIAGDGTSPGADTDQQGLINNLTASAPGTTATICYDLTSVNNTVPVMLQMSTSPDFDVVPSVLDPSLVAPIGGVTVNSSDFPGYTVSGNHRCYVIAGLDSSTKYYYRIHSGGQLYGAFAENNPPPSLTTGSVGLVTGVTVLGPVKFKGKITIK